MSQDRHTPDTGINQVLQRRAEALRPRAADLSRQQVALDHEARKVQQLVQMRAGIVHATHQRLHVRGIAVGQVHVDFGAARRPRAGSPRGRGERLGDRHLLERPRAPGDHGAGGLHGQDDGRDVREDVAGEARLVGDARLRPGVAVRRDAEEEYGQALEAWERGVW